MQDLPFQLPLAVDLAAVGLFAATGAMAARQKRYDLVGAVVLALVVGLGGALLRDGLFLQAGPPAALRDGRYLAVVLVGAAVGVFFARYLDRLRLGILLADAVGLGLYAVYGAQKALLLDLPPLSAVLVGTVNAVGGGLLRDVLVRDEPLLFKPGQFYAVAAVAGCSVFVLVDGLAGQTTRLAATAGVLTALALRVGSIRLGWRTGALSEEPPGP
ncbi:MAG: TRIC cation channel family protein [Anaeromyxobacter sp.]|nr:TRIC cation channel family protein [Anaeromyxobacter sp.]MBL0276342.1 TRIC cation channel family protein [Anaeromyxobacter sp.]